MGNGTLQIALDRHCEPWLAQQLLASSTRSAFFKIGIYPRSRRLGRQRNQRMHESKRLIGDALRPLLKRHGYRKTALTWHKRGEDLISVFHIEKNRWGADRYSFHLGVYLRALGSEESPPHYRCPIQATLDRLVPDSTVWKRAADFEDASLKVNDRLSQIVDLTSAHALPWLERYSNLRELSHLMQTDYISLLPRVLVNGEAYHYLRRLGQTAYGSVETV